MAASAASSEQIETTGIPFAAFEMKFATEMVQTIQKHSQKVTRDITSVDIRGKYDAGAVVALARNKGRFVMVLPGVDGTAKVPKHMEYAITRIVIGSNDKKIKKQEKTERTVKLQPPQSDSTDEPKSVKTKRLTGNPKVKPIQAGGVSAVAEGDLDDDLQGVLALINLGKPKRKRTVRNVAPSTQSEPVDVDAEDDDDMNLQYPPSMVGTGVVGRRTSPHRTVFPSSAPSSEAGEDAPVVGRLSQPEPKKKVKRGGRRVEDGTPAQPSPPLQSQQHQKQPHMPQPKESPQRTTFSSSSSSSSYTYSAWTQDEAK